MTFKNIHEARNWFRQYKPLTEKVPYFMYDYKETWKFGDYILFQHIKSSDARNEYDDKNLVISRPILAIFTGYKFWDQALVINFVQPQRAWMNSHKVITNPDPEHLHSMEVSCLDDEVEAIQFWTDNIKVINYWKQKPAIWELKSALTEIKEHDIVCLKEDGSVGTIVHVCPDGKSYEVELSFPSKVVTLSKNQIKKLG